MVPFMADMSRNPFRAMLWKEMREGWKVALIALVVVGCTQLLSLGIQTVVNDGDTVVTYATSPQTSFFTLTTAIVGLIIGGYCVARERSGDMRAWLVHRPVEPAVLFWAKASAAAFWYLIATILPLVVYSVVRLRRADVGAPFLPAMLLPDAADAMCGLAYVLAGMLVMMRQARWFGSRLAPAGAAIEATIVVMLAPTFALAMLALAVVLIVLTIAARSTFIAGGYYAPLSKLNRVAVALVVASGVYVFGGVVAGLAETFTVLEAAQRDTYVSTGVVIGADGAPVRVTREYQGSSAFSRVLSVRDTSGNIIAQTADTAPHLASGRRVSAGVFTAPDIVLNPASEYRTVGRHGYRGAEDFFVQLLAGSRTGRTSWFYLRGARAIELFDLRGRQPRHAGWLGPDGFLPGDTLPTHRFPNGFLEYAGYSHQQPLIAFPSDVYRIDFANRGIRRVFTAPVGELVVGASSSGDSTAQPQFPAGAQFDAIATTGHLYIQSFDGTPQVRLPRDPAAARYGTLEVTRALEAPNAPVFAWYLPSNGTLSRAELDTAHQRITEFAANGTQVAQSTIPREAFPSGVRTQWTEIVLTGLFEPIAIRGWHTVVGTVDESARPEDRSAARALGLGAALLAALLSALLNALIAKRYAFERRRRIGWTVAAFLSGPFGVLLLLSLPEWPAREACPSCHQKRLVTREYCEHCNAPFPPPPLDGTEVFEPVMAAS
ncbi:MAG TPA: hypothetical protein VGM50_00620 [Gemmatimonadaceae bacterium]